MYLLVTEWRRIIDGLIDPLLWPDMDTDINDPIDSEHNLLLYTFESWMLRGTSASDEPVSVDTGLVLLDVNELNALVFRICLAAVPLPFGGRLPFTSRNVDLFCRKISRRVCSSSFDFFVFSANEIGGLLPISSSTKWETWKNH